MPVNRDIRKLELLRQMIELLIYCGYDIKPYIGRPLSYFNWDAVSKYIKALKREKNKIDGI